MEDEGAQREEKIRLIMRKEIADGGAMASEVALMALDLLSGCKGYAQEDIRHRVEFDVVLGPETVRSKVDFLVSLDGRNAMVIKCAAGSLSSRERHVIAAARVVADPIVPIAVVMDPSSALIIDSASGKVIGEGYESIPTKEQLEVMLSERGPRSLAADKLEREKRVLLAFDAIQCCVPQGADGGVSLE